jgi:hypothetical protein
VSLVLNIETKEKGKTIKAYADGYKKQVKGMEKQAVVSNKKIGTSLAAVKTSYLAITAAVAGTVIGLKKLISSTVTYGDAIGKTGDKLGINVEKLQEYQFAAERSGVSTETLNMALQRFGRRVGEAAKGTGEAKQALIDMGIEVKDKLTGRIKTVEELLPQVADHLANLTSAEERNALAMKLFDSEGVALVNMLKEGSLGLEEFTKRFRELGGVMSEEQVRNAEKFKDATKDLSAAWVGLRNDAIGPLIPKMTNLMNLLTEDQLNWWEKLGVIVRGQVTPVIERLTISLDELYKKLSEIGPLPFFEAPEVGVVAYRTIASEMKKVGEMAHKYTRDLSYLKEWKEPAKELRGFSDEFIGLMPEVEKIPFEFSKWEQSLARITPEIKQIGMGIENIIISALDQAIIRGRDLSSVMKNVSDALWSLALKFAIQQIPIPGMARGGTIPSYQSGGVVGRPRLIMAHEGEGVVNNQGMQAIGSKGLARINQGNSFGDINLSINTSMVDEKFVRRKLAPILKEISQDGVKYAD